MKFGIYEEEWRKNYCLNYLRWVKKKAPKIYFMAFGFDGITRTP